MSNIPDIKDIAFLRGGGPPIIIARECLCLPMCLLSLPLVFLESVDFKNDVFNPSPSNTKVREYEGHLLQPACIMTFIITCKITAIIN